MTAFHNAAPADLFTMRAGMMYALTDETLGTLHGFANDANLDAATLSEPLQQFIATIVDPTDLLGILESLAPSVPVARRFSYKTHSNKEAFMTDDDDSDMRQIGGDFKTVDAKGDDANGKTHNKGLAMVIDHDEGGEMPEIQQRAVESLRNRLLRTEIIRVLRILDANDSNTGVNWGPTNAARDPDSDLLSLVDGSGDKRGFNPSLVVLGGGAALKRVIALRTKTAPEEVGARLTDEQLADFLKVERVVTLNARRQSTVSTKAKLLGDVAFAYDARKGLSKEDPSNIKRFVTPTTSGLMRVHVIPKMKRTLVAVEHYSDIICTSDVGIEKLTVTFN